MRLACLACLFMVCPSASPATADDVLRVYVAIKPLQFLVERVGGREVTVKTLVQPGQEPETYEPTARQVAGLSDAGVFFGVGLPLEAVWRRQLPKGSDRRPLWVDLSQGLTSGEGDSRVAGGRDPHVWLSPANAQRMAAAIADALAQMSPDRAHRFRANAGKLVADLQTLDHEITEILKRSTVRSFMVFHPAWGYFAREYGLRQIAIESEGKEPGPKALTQIINRAREEGIHTVFVDPSHSDRLAATMAAALGGGTRVLDPLAYDYIHNLRDVARAIADSGS
jgi:zinc transport system substrate-binding protein